MTFQWTPHRFTGGALALDVANSVILRFDEKRRTDRFAMPEQLDAFAGAAGELCAERDEFPELSPVGDGREADFIGLREAIDAHFRHRTIHGRDDNRLVAGLLGRLSATFAAHARDPAPCPVDLATARSALKLIASPDTERLKICPNCEWLFIDRSKNRSRTWCDMSVCGNRAKARLHYKKRRKETSP
jgi:predicted RNA-binding Zn ribbon-like protein